MGFSLPTLISVAVFFCCCKGIGVGLYLPFGVGNSIVYTFVIDIQLWFQLWMTLVPPLSYHFFHIVFHCVNVAYCFRSGVISVLHVQQGHLLCIASVFQDCSDSSINFQEFLLSVSAMSPCSIFWNPTGTIWHTRVCVASAVQSFAN